jgi:hypothetical protein
MRQGSPPPFMAQQAPTCSTSASLANEISWAELHNNCYRQGMHVRHLTVCLTVWLHAAPSCPMTQQSLAAAVGVGGGQSSEHKTNEKWGAVALDASPAGGASAASACLCSTKGPPQGVLLPQSLLG